jgi:tRNA1Val (adenine37-N6)-methyltransferase
LNSSEADGRAARPSQPDDWTEDTLRGGRVHLLQPRDGFRSSLDPVLLAAFIAPPLAPPLGRFLDIGCGTGAVAFLLADQVPTATGIAVEIQPRLAELAERGCSRNGFSSRLQIVRADIRGAAPRVGQPPRAPGLLARASFDLVAINPPFRPVDGGVPSPNPERAQANHEVTLALDEWLMCAAELLRPGGRLDAIFPAERLVPLATGCQERGLTVTRLRFVHARVGAPAARVLLEARLHGRQTLLVEPPLILHEADGAYRAEVRRML